MIPTHRSADAWTEGTAHSGVRIPRGYAGTTNANLPPPRQQNSVQSVATIPDGYTVVVGWGGGLELVTSGEGVSQVPLLGSIPIIGEAFKNRSNNSGRQRFYVFLRANVLRQNNLEDLKYLSDNDAAAVNIPTGWPDVEPLVIGGRKGR